MDNHKKKKTILKKRGIAFAIDYFLIMLVHKTIMLTLTGFITSHFFHLPEKVINQAIEGAQMSSLPISLVIFWGYFITSYYLGNGQTVGKLFLGLRIYGENEVPTLKESALRTLGYFCCFLTLSFLFILPYFTKSRKGIPDWISDTFVEYDDYSHQTKNSNIHIQPELFPLEENKVQKSA